MIPKKVDEEEVKKEDEFYSKKHLEKISKDKLGSIHNKGLFIDFETYVRDENALKNFDGKVDEGNFHNFAL